MPRAWTDVPGLVVVLEGESRARAVDRIGVIGSSDFGLREDPPGGDEGMRAN
jgi:hypothetical protein